MRRWIHIGVVVFGVVLAACSGDKPKELLETAEFEERQHNVAHAKQLYEEIVSLYPSSPQAGVSPRSIETKPSPCLTIFKPFPPPHVIRSNRNQGVPS